MKKYLIVVLLLVPCLCVFSVDLGIGADVGGVMDHVKEDAFKATDFVTELIPALVIMMSPQLEIRPFVIIGYSVESDPDAISTWREDYSRWWLGAGAGLFYHFIQGQRVSLSSGPRASVKFYMAPQGTSAPTYTSYFNMVASVELPINLDVRLSERLYLRTGTKIFGIGLETSSWEDGGVEYVETTLIFADNFGSILSDLPVYLGFYLMF